MLNTHLCIVSVAQLGHVIPRQGHLTDNGQGVIIDELPWHQDITYALDKNQLKILSPDILNSPIPMSRGIYTSSHSRDHRPASCHLFKI